MELINKTALIAEIEERQKRNQLDCTPEGSGAFYEDGFIIDIINSLGVKKKEVNLGEELSDFIMSYRNKETGYSLYQLAEHFFNLGLKVQKGEFKKESETNCPNFDEAQGTPITK